MKFDMYYPGCPECENEGLFTMKVRSDRPTDWSCGTCGNRWTEDWEPPEEADTKDYDRDPYGYRGEGA